MIAYVRFGSSGHQYGYQTGSLHVAEGDWLVVPVGRNDELKIVQCVAITGEADPYAYKVVWGKITRQSEGASNASSI